MILQGCKPPEMARSPADTGLPHKMARSPADTGLPLGHPSEGLGCPRPSLTLTLQHICDPNLPVEEHSAMVVDVQEGELFGLLS